MYRVETDEIAADYNSRAWGCTQSKETCESGCNDDELCTDFRCCYADTYFNNDTSLNMTDYRKCIYGKSGELGLRRGLWAAGLVGVAIVRDMVGI